jgi:hypothetical protein
MDLRTTTGKLLRDPDPAQWLRLADSYIQAYNRIPDKFVLPAQHAFLKPIIESFAQDTQALSRYILALRDAVDGGARDELHALYRTISMRALQTDRRARIKRAVSVLEEQYRRSGRALDHDELQRVSRFVEQTWGDMRMQAMAMAREQLKAKRLTVEERAIELSAFWRTIDAALDNNTVLLGESGPSRLDEILEE